MTKWVLFFLLIAAPVQARNLWVSKSGNDSNGCTDSASPLTTTAKLTIANVIANCSLVAGDTVNIRVGTYNETITDLPIGGTSYNNAVTFQAFSSEVVTIGTGGFGILAPAPGVGISRGFFIFKNLRMSDNVISIGGGGSGGTVTNIKLDGVQVSNVTGARSCVYLGDGSGSTSNNWITNSIIDGCGTGIGDANQYHGVYVDSPNNQIDHTEIKNVPNGFGIHNYSGGAGVSANNTYFANTIHLIGVGNNSLSVACAILGDGDNNAFFNNLCYDSQQGAVSTGSHTGTKVLSNTFYHLGTTAGLGCVNGGSGDCRGIEMSNGADSPVIQNNIVFTVTGTPIYTSGSVSPTSTGNITANPFFVNAASADFHLLSGSPAIGAGVALAAAYATDFDGMSRPQGSDGLWDAGAYEFLFLIPPPTVTIAMPISGCTTTSTSPKACTTSNATLTITGTSSLP